MVLNVIKGFISFRKTFCYAVNDLVSMFSLNCCLKVLTSFLVVKSQSKKSWRKFFFSRDLFADIMSMHNRNMKHTHAIEFD